MGDNKLLDWNKHKQYISRSNFIYVVNNCNIGSILNRSNMEWTGILIKIASLLLFPLWIFTWVINIDNTKSTILFIAAMIMGGVRFYFFIKKQSQALHRERQAAQMRDLDIKDRYQKANEIELKQLEEELSLRVTGLTVEQRRNRDNK